MNGVKNKTCYVMVLILAISPLCAIGDYSIDYANGLSWYHEYGGLGYHTGFDHDLYNYKPTIPVTTKGDIVIPTKLGKSTITKINHKAFYQCSSITSVLIPDTITFIGQEAFYMCSSITNFIIPESVSSIGKQTFMQCVNLNSITLPSTTAEISDGLFWCCEKLLEIELPNTVTNIGKNAFQKSGISHITIPDNVKSLGEFSFSYCTNLTEMRIPKSVSQIGRYPFYMCDNLVCIEFDGDAPTVNGILFENINSNCCSYVRKNSSGWGVEIPGFWKQARIDYAKYYVDFIANGASGAMASQQVFLDEETNLTQCSFSWNDYAFAGWSFSPKGSVEFEDGEMQGK